MERIHSSHITKDKKKVVEPRAQFNKATTINERYPNDNLFKNDIRYQMKSDLTFESNIDEENAYRDILDRYHFFHKYAVPLVYLNFVLFSFNNLTNIFFTILSISIYSICVYILWLKNIKDKISQLTSDASLSNSNSFLNLNTGIVVRILLGLLHYLYLIFKLDFTSYEFTLLNLIFLSLPSLGLNISFDTSLKSVAGFSLLNGIVFLCCTEYPDSNFVYRLILNLLSSKLLIIFLYVFLECICRFYIKKGLRELWALYDSFKRSYFTIKKSLFDDFPYPVFIFNKKCNNHLIFYKNLKAEELIGKIKNTKISNDTISSTGNTTQTPKKPIVERKTIGFTRRIIPQKANSSSLRKDEFLEDLFVDKDLENIFEMELEKCVYNKKRYFDFPLRTSGKKTIINFHQSLKNITFFEGDLENLDWYRIVINPCLWKSSDAFYIQMIKNDDFYKNNLVCNYLTLIGQEFGKAIENVDKICDRIIEAESPVNKQQNRDGGINSAPTTGFGLGKSKRFSVISPDIVSFPNKYSPTEINTPLSLNVKNRDITRKPIIKRQVTINQSKTTTLKDFTNISIITTVQLPKYDHSIWFFLKYNISFLYDMSLTIKIYNSIMSKRYYPYDFKINLKEFLDYFNDYFTIPCKIKNVKLIILNNSNDEEFVICYQYFRTVFFNILLFIINNSLDNSIEKIIEINIRSEKEITYEDYKIKFFIKYKDEKVRILYNDVNKILTNKNSIHGVNKDDTRRIKIIDVGMVTIYNILNQIYDNEISLQSEESIHSISFYLKGTFHKESSKISENYPYIRFQEPNDKNYDQYYNKILQKTFKINLPSKIKILNSNDKLNEFVNGKMIKGMFPSKGVNNDKIEGIESDTSNEKLLPQEMNISIERDCNMVNETNINLSKHFDNYDKLLNLKDESKNSFVIKKISRKLKFLNMNFNINKMENTIKFVDDCRSNIKYFNPPRFLIVEDNAFGRINLIDILKKQKLDYLIDIAAYGWESIQKFKFFLNKG